MKNKLTLTTLLCLFLSTGIRAQFLDVEFRDQSVTMQLNHSGKFLQGDEEDANSSALYQNSEVPNSLEQVFTIESTNDAIWYRIYHPASGKYVTTTNVSDGGQVELKYDFESGPANQEFKFVEQAVDDRYKIHSRHNLAGVALVLEIEAGNLNNFTGIRLKKNKNIGNESHQKFDLLNVSASDLASRALVNDGTIVGKDFHITNKGTSGLLGDLGGSVGQLTIPDYSDVGAFLFEDGSDDGKWWTPDARWFHIRSRSDGRYLTVPDASPGTVVVLDTLYPNLANSEQQFRLIPAPAGSGWYKLRCRNGGLVLELRPNGTLVVETATAGAAPYQKFSFNLDIPHDPATQYALIGKQHGDYLTDEGILAEVGQEGNMKRIRQADQSIYWNFIDAGNGYFKIRNALTFQYIVAVGNSNLTGDIRSVHPDDPKADQDNALWELVRKNDNFRLKSKYNGFYLGTPPLNENIIPQLITQDNTKWYFIRSEGVELAGLPGNMEKIADNELPEGCFIAYGEGFMSGLAERVGLPAETQYFGFIQSAVSSTYGLQGNDLSDYLQRIDLNNNDHRAELAYAVRIYVTEDLAFRPVSTWSAEDVYALAHYEQIIKENRQDYANRLDQRLTDFLSLASNGETPTFSNLFQTANADNFSWPQQFKGINPAMDQILAAYIRTGANAGHENRLLPEGASRSIGFTSSMGISVGSKFVASGAANLASSVASSFLAKQIALVGAAEDISAAVAGKFVQIMAVSKFFTGISGATLPITIGIISTQILVEQVVATIELVQLENDVQDIINWAAQDINIHDIMEGNDLVEKMKLLDDLDFIIGVPANNVTQLEQSTFNGYLFTNNDNVYQPAFDDPVCKNITVDLDAQTGSVSISPEDVRADNLLILPICGGPVQWSLSRNTFNCNDLGPQTVSLTLSNSKRTASCQATVTVRDETLPNANCKNLSITLNTNGYSGIDPEDIDNNSWDNCSITLRTTNRSDFGCADVGENTVTLTVEDGSGNTNSCTSTVTVIDNIPPSATCQGLTVQLNAAGSASITPVQVDNGSADACLPLSLSLDQQDFDCSHVGNNTVTLTVTDNNGNSSQCQANISVEDNVDPVALCRNITAGLDANGQVSITPQQVDDGSSDACGIANLSLNTSGFQCTDRGPNSVELTVTDINGNSSNCIATVNVADNIAPTIKCYNPTVAIEPDGDFELTLADVYDAAQSFDNCGITQVLFDPVTYTCAEAGMSFNVPVSIQDAAGNISSCNANVQVVIGTALPPQWTSTDIGSQGNGNTYTFDPCTSENPALGTFSVSTGGYNLMPFNSDNLAFIGRELCNNGGIQAKIEHIEGGFAGLMIRESSEPGSKMTAVFSNNTSMLRWETRYNTNGDKSAIALFRPFPYWLRLVRQGNWIRGFYSTTGNNWQLAHQVYLPMADCVEMGLAVFTTDPSGQADAQFSNVQSQSGVGGGSLVTPAPAFSSASTSAHQRADVFPNPHTGSFTLTFEQPLPADGIFILRNELGQQVSTLPLQSGTTHTVVRNDNLPAGLYFGAVETEDGYREVLKILRQ